LMDPSAHGILTAPDKGVRGDITRQTIARQSG
jgi:hypothetical protein